MLEFSEIVWWAHAVATWMMTGIIWLVQVVVYPGFARVPEEAFVAWHRDYTRRMGWVVGPLMLAELVGAILWVAIWPEMAVGWVCLGAVGALWGITAIVQVPQHRRLATGRDEALIRRLVGGNWSRTVLWSMRAVLVAVVAGQS